jgi:lambda repressor-like predicted transcriptional regulator/DNA-binding transcriptional regulator YdaS (Cro superfamily)
MHERGISDVLLARMTGLTLPTIKTARMRQEPLKSATPALIARTLGVNQSVFWPQDDEKGAPLHHYMLSHDISAEDIADVLGVTRSAVNFWRFGKRRMKIEHAHALNERCRIPKHVLRPDIWKPPSGGSRSAGGVPPHAGSERGGLPDSAPEDRRAAAA